MITAPKKTLRYRLWTIKKWLHKRLNAFVSLLPVQIQTYYQRLNETYRQRVTNRKAFAHSYTNYLDIQKNTSVFTRSHEKARESVARSASQLLNYLESPSLILDAGCGDGLAQDIFAEAGHDSVGLDINFEKLLVARQHNQAGSVADLHFLPLKTASFDAVHCSHVLEHMLDSQLFLGEIGRVIKPGATLLFALPLGPGNRKHPTAFVTDQDALRFVGRYFNIVNHWLNAARGHHEIVILARNE